VFGTFATMDEWVANWLHEHATPSFTTTMRASTVLGSPPFVVLVMFIAIAVLMLRSERYGAMQMALCVGGGMLINTGLKNIFDRARPHFEPALTEAYGYSFPSGHVAAATLLYGAVMVLAWHRLPAGVTRNVVVVALFLLVQLVSLSRMYLGVHYLTDVLAAQFLSALWITISFIAVEIFRRRRLAVSQPGAGAGESR
jgi:membrane-associated phospholipid phosphatase